MDKLGPRILGNIDVSDAAPALTKFLLALDKTTILALTDRHGTILAVNENFCKISKYSRDELVGQNHRLIRSGYHSREFFTDLWSTISSGETWEGEIRNTAKDGSTYWVETTIVPFLDDEGLPDRYVAIRKDITQKKILEEQIANERARTIHSEKMASLGEISAGIAHEIGNPLAAIRGRVEMMKMKKDGMTSEDVEKYSDTLLDLVDRTSKIIRGLKSFARDASEDPMKEEDINLLASDILEFSNSRLRKNNVTLIKKGFNKAVKAFCREAEIGQVLVNLVNNACDILKNEKIREIEVELVSDNDSVEIHVSDSGPGISEALREKIFDPFFTTKDVGSGTGLGLSISKRIMQSHGGSISLSTGEKTCFVISWPKK